MRRAVLSALSRWQRPVAWVVFVCSIIGFFAVLFNIIATGQAKVATLFAAVCVMQQGWDSVVTVETELDSEGSVDAAD